MKTVVDTYKGFEIRFDTEKETFTCDIDDSRSVKKSYSAIKKFIKDWCEENQHFKPIMVIADPSRIYTRGEKGEIVGIHGNGNLLYKKLGSTKREQIGTYDLTNYVIYKPEIDELNKKLDILDEERKEFLKRHSDQYDKLIEGVNIVSLKDKIDEIKQQYK